MKKKNPTLAGNGAEGCGDMITRLTPSLRPLSARCQRLLVALVNQAEVSREQADRIAHASNAPHWIGVLRHQHRVDVHMRHEPHTDFDGKSGWHGVYFLTDDGKVKGRWLLQEAQRSQPDNPPVGH